VKRKVLLLTMGFSAMCLATASAQTYSWSTIATGFSDPTGLRLNSGGDLFVVDHQVIQKLTRVGTNWVSTVIAGLEGAGCPFADGTNSAARFCWSFGIAIDAGGSLYVPDQYVARKVTPVGSDWAVSTIAGLAGSAGSADGTNSAARFNYQPHGVAVDSSGCIYVADTTSDTIRKITPVGTNWVVSTIAGLAGSNGSADGTNSAARFWYPFGVAVDALGNVYVADTLNYTIRQMTPVGTNWIVTTIAGSAGSFGNTDGTNNAARLGRPFDVTVDNGGNLYVADYDNGAIRKIVAVGTNWVVSTIADLTALKFQPQSVTVDGSGNLYVAVGGNYIIRQGLTSSFYDGIPDWWRQKFFTTSATTNNQSCATCDADGTGQNNLFKYTADLDPTNPASVFVLKVVSVTGQPTQKNLIFNPVVGGRTYTPEFRTNLVSGVYTKLTGFSGPNTNGNQVTVTDLSAVEKQKFYHVHISLP
jgi:hypothetical protein